MFIKRNPLNDLEMTNETMITFDDPFCIELQYH